MKSGEQIITKDLIVQHNLTDDEYKKIVVDALTIAG
jgi:hypothetical protein